MENIQERKRHIQQMFNSIARHYDLLNHLLSGGVDIYWRRRALGRVRQQPQRILDLATGTGDFALSSRRLQAERIIGVDVALNMLRLGGDKLGKREANTAVRLLGGDAEQLPFADACFDLVTVAFGVRNFGSISAGLQEARRVLRPGGELLVLDFAEPEMVLFKQLYRFYFTRILPFIGGMISGNWRAYSYLPQSVGTFPQGQAFIKLLEEAGFADNLATALTLGICRIYQGRKPGTLVD